MAVLSLPVEIIGMVFTHLHPLSFEHQAALLNSGLVSKQFNAQTRRIVFETILFNGELQDNSDFATHNRIIKLNTLITAPLSTIPTESVRQMIVSNVYLETLLGPPLVELWRYIPNAKVLHLIDVEHTLPTAWPAGRKPIRSLEIKGSVPSTEHLEALLSNHDLESVGLDNVVWKVGPSSNDSKSLDGRPVKALRVTGTDSASCLVWALRQERFGAISELVVGPTREKEIKALARFLASKGAQLKKLTLESQEGVLGESLFSCFLVWKLDIRYFR